MATIVCVGNAALDRVWQVALWPRPGEKMRASDYLEVGGGQAANAAVAVSRLGGTARLVSVVGGDTAGAKICDDLAAEGVDISAVARVAGARSVTSAILVDLTGERGVIGDVDPHLHAAPPAVDLAILAAADAVLADVKWPAVAEPLLAAARRGGVPVVLDIEPAAPGYQERLVGFADHAIFGQAGLAAFTGTADPEVGLTIAVGRLAAQVVGVTLGGLGVRLANAGNRVTVPAMGVGVVDTTGAGDAFHGAYALAIGEGRDWIAAARFATAVAALKCTKLGSRAGLPTRVEVDRLMAGA